MNSQYETMDTLGPRHVGVRSVPTLERTKKGTKFFGF